MKVIYKIKKIRKEKNLTLKELSKKSGVSKTEINDIENNIKEPRFTTMVLIAKGLKVDLDKIYKVRW